MTHGAFGHAEQLTDLAVLPLFQVVQQHDLALMFRQRLHRGREPRPQGGTLGVPSRIRVARRLQRPLERCRGSHPLLAQGAERAVPHDPQQPGTEAMRLGQRVELLQCGDERVLTDVVRVGRVEQHTERNRVRSTQVPADEVFERGFVARTGSSDQSGVDFCHRLHIDARASLSVGIDERLWTPARPRAFRSARAGLSADNRGAYLQEPTADGDRMRCPAAALVLLALPLPSAAQWEPMETGTDAEFRSADAPADSILWAGGRGGVVLRTVDRGATWRADTIPGARNLFFIGISARGADTAVVLGTGFDSSTARIYRTTDGGASWTQTWADDREGIFLDGIAFWDDRRGIAFGDPVDGSFVVLVTSDGGATWSAVPVDSLPAPLAGEAGFAASGRAIVVQPGGHAWFGTGGAGQARVFRTPDYGATWTTAATPIESGMSKGIFALAFIDTLTGFAVGGDHTARAVASDNILRTEDGGRIWTSAGSSLPAGVRYGAALLPGSRPATLVAVGPSGSGYSKDGGASWTVIDHEHWNTVVFSPDGTGWVLGPEGRVGRWRGFSAQTDPR